jgi:hypothetical protein
MHVSRKTEMAVNVPAVLHWLNTYKNNLTFLETSDFDRNESYLWDKGAWSILAARTDLTITESNYQEHS